MNKLQAAAYDNYPSEQGLSDYGPFAVPDFSLPNVKVAALAVWMDYENIFIAMKERGYPQDPARLMRAVRAALRQYGEIVSVKAYADWGMLDPVNGLALQRNLADEGVEVIYLSNKRGKNSADMRIVRDIRDQLECGPGAPCQFDLVTLVSGDRDFNDLIGSLHLRRKPVIVMGFRGSMSRDLAQSADRVSYLDEYYIHRVSPYQNGARVAVHAAALALRNHEEGCASQDLLQSLGGGPEAERELNEAVEQGIFLTRVGARPLMLDWTNPLVKAAGYMAVWVLEKIQDGLRRPGFTYVDTRYLVNGALYDRQLCGLGILGGRPEMEAWLALLAETGRIRKTTHPSAKNPAYLVDAWLPGSPTKRADGSHETAGFPPAFLPQP